MIIKIHNTRFHDIISIVIVTTGLPHYSSYSIPVVMEYSERDYLNKGVECRYVKQKSRFSTTIGLHRVLLTV